MVDIDSWLESIKSKIEVVFANRILFIGYQGSYRRGEATPESDIDIVVILDNLEMDDLRKYKNIVQSMPHSEKACGFISGKDEISNWSKSDMFQFIYETQSLLGKLEHLVSPLNKSDIEKAIKTGAENLYQAACHSFLYDGDIKQNLSGLYKMTFFILQAEHFFLTCQYVPTKKELLGKLKGQDKEILSNCINRNLLSGYDMEKVETLYDKLIKWCSRRITKPNCDAC
jgi:uncharacterized protein